MARTRQIKPEFFKSDELVKLGWETMILFAGLWTLADREGRLRDRVPVIHGELFPYSKSMPIDEMLSTLGESGFIQRYTFDGQNYIQIVNFTKHQKPHPNEAPSIIPDFNQCQKSSIPKDEATRACINSSDSNSSDSGRDDTTPFAVVDNLETPERLSALEIFNDWINIQANRDKVATLCKFYGESFVRGELFSVRAWLTANDLKAFNSWSNNSCGGDYRDGILPWLNAWMKRTKDKPAKLTTPITAQQEADHYAGHRRTGVDTGFTKIGEIE